MALLIAVIRSLVFIAVLVAIVAGLDLYMQWDRRRTLEEEHAAGEAPELTREDYVARGLAVYRRSWTRKALLGLFLLPPLIGMILVSIAYA